MPTEDTPSASNGTLIERIGYRIATFVEKWMPIPFLFVIILSYITFVLGMGIEGASPVDMVWHWFDGFWIFLTFSMQMALILLTGYMVAYHPRANDLVKRLAQIPNSSTQAVALVGVFAMVMSWVHWGLGLILGAIFAREMGKVAYQNDIDVHYPLLCVAGYMGLGLTWHWGLSSSAGLLLATPGNEFIQLGVMDEVLPVSATIFSPYTLILFILSVLYATVLMVLLDPPESRSRPITEYISEEKILGTEPDGGEASGKDPDAQADGGVATEKVVDEEAVGSGKRDPADIIDNSRIMGGIIAGTGVIVSAYLFATKGLDALNLNTVNWTFLMIGLLLWLNPSSYRDKFNEAARSAGGIILLFPFFAGIQGMMSGSGLTLTFAEFLLSISNVDTFPIFAWITGAVLNLFIPSGGGEFQVVGPPLLEAAQSLGVPNGQATMAYAVGDAHTNLLNPLWAIPLIAITKIRAREMFGYAVAMLLLLIPFLALALYFVPYMTL